MLVCIAYSKNYGWFSFLILRCSDKIALSSDKTSIYSLGENKNEVGAT